MRGIQLEERLIKSLLEILQLNPLLVVFLITLVSKLGFCCIEDPHPPFIWKTQKTPKIVNEDWDAESTWKLAKLASICWSGISYSISSPTSVTNLVSKAANIDLTKSFLHVPTYHFLCHLLRHIFVELEEELDGVVVLVLPVELLGVVHAQPQLQAWLHHVILLCQLHMYAIVFLEEGVIQKVLNGVPIERK